MNSLEFIDEEIKQLEERKENAFKNEYYSIYKECSQKITALQQIKSELEALKIIKNKLVLSVETETTIDGNGVAITGYWLVQGDCQKSYIIIEKQEYEILKKALEVEDEKSN